MRNKYRAVSAVLFFSSCVALSAADPLFAPPAGEPWKRHIIDTDLKKSEGTRIADVNGDGLTDIVAGWEKEGITRLYINPGAALAKEPWPSVTVGRTPSVEDALPFDLDLDGKMEVVSSQEEGAKRVAIHWGPADAAKLMDEAAWETAEFAQVKGLCLWMFAAPITLQPNRAKDLIIGGKNDEDNEVAHLGLLIAPQENRRDASAWKWHSLAEITWAMSIVAHDMNGDGFEDIVFSDKKGKKIGFWWLKNPGGASGGLSDAPWEMKRLSPPKLYGAHFLTVADLDGDGLHDILGPIEYDELPGPKEHGYRRILFLRRESVKVAKFATHEILVPPGSGRAKGIAIGDINGDKRNDIVITSSGAEDDEVGAYWMEAGESATEPIWKAHNISGKLGTKYDLVHLIDLDGDGDLDVLTNDEADGKSGLGVFWFENPN